LQNTTTERDLDFYVLYLTTFSKHLHRHKFSGNYQSEGQASCGGQLTESSRMVADAAWLD